VTRRLYYDDAYRQRFTAKVVGVEDLGSGRQGVILDGSFFYPTSGGQMHDVGTLDGHAVVDVIDETDRIVHVVEGSSLAVGREVEGCIDAERRRQHRQQHTGQHVLSRVVEDELGLPTVSSRLGESGNTLDLNCDPLDRADLDRVEDETNRRLWEGHAVEVLYLEEDEAAVEGLRKKVERAGPVRVIDVEGVDRCACGGTHVRHTAEVGLVAITGSERIKGGFRIQFLCGERAARWRRTRHQWLDTTARRLSTGHDQVADTVDALLHETKERQKRIAVLAAELVVTRCEGWLAEAAPSAGGTRVVVRQLDADEATAAATALRRLSSHDGTVAALAWTEGEKGQVLVGRSATVEVDCQAVLRDVLQKVGGSGGGRPDHARGGFEASRILEVLDSLRVQLAEVGSK
jgi:alanyl-tRNA synthetase